MVTALRLEDEDSSSSAHDVVFGCLSIFNMLTTPKFNKKLN
jgi:hypothetical protein